MALILVVDDNYELLQAIRIFLQKHGEHEVVVSTNGEDALAQAAANPPDLAIVDVMMPNMTGYEVCRQLRAAEATANIPIIILTARGQEIDRHTALEAGANLHITKPMMMADLLEEVDTLLESTTKRGSEETKGLIGLLSLRGGVGVTTLAVNLALVLQSRTDGRVCLVDLCPSSGNIALQLGTRPDPNWSDLAHSESPIDSQVIRAHLLEHPSGLHLLAAPFVPLRGRSLSPGWIEDLLSTLRQDFDTVILDLPPTLDDAGMAAAATVDLIGLVLGSDPASIQATVGTLQALRQLAEKTRLILNQVSPGQPANAQALERVFRRPLSGIIPFDSAQAQALSRGKPLGLADSESPLVQSLIDTLPALRTAGSQQEAQLR